MQRRTIKFIIVGITIQAMSILTWIWIEPCFILIFSICHDFWDIAGPDARLQFCFIFTRRIYTITTIALCGMMYYYTWSGLVWYKCVEFRFILHTHSIPFLESASFLGMIAYYLWHAFSEEADPTNQYINSITIVLGGNNVWNEDYHVVHHH
jgi:hypothetical protein